MRAQTVYKTAYVLDFDECLATTDAKINIFRNGAFYKSLNSKEYNEYKRKPGDKLDFSEFNDGEKIINAERYKMWYVVKNVSDAIKEGNKTAVLYILSARSSVVRPFIYKFLKSYGIEIDLENILTIGDNVGKVNISEEKRKALVALKNEYDYVVFYDDDPKNIALAKSIPGIKTRLVESYTFTRAGEMTDQLDLGKYKGMNPSFPKEIKDTVLTLRKLGYWQDKYDEGFKSSVEGNWDLNQFYWDYKDQTYTWMGAKQIWGSLFWLDLKSPTEFYEKNDEYIFTVINFEACLSIHMIDPNSETAKQMGGPIVAEFSLKNDNNYSQMKWVSLPDSYEKRGINTSEELQQFVTKKLRDLEILVKRFLHKEHLKYN